jgi:hypothetical protein
MADEVAMADTASAATNNRSNVTFITKPNKRTHLDL